MERISHLIQSLQHNPIISLFFLSAYPVSGKLTDSQPGHTTKRWHLILLLFSLCKGDSHARGCEQYKDR
jgi:hypothetical protein